MPRAEAALPHHTLPQYQYHTQPQYQYHTRPQYQSDALLQYGKLHSLLIFTKCAERSQARLSHRTSVNPCAKQHAAYSAFRQIAYGTWSLGLPRNFLVSPHANSVPDIATERVASERAPGRLHRSK
eukprot:3847365-Rhodomonas_salina.1